MKASTTAGLILVALGAWLLFGGLGATVSWVLGYWDREFVETYRGYEIYYFTTIGVYGVHIPEAPRGERWRFFGSIDAARGFIDDMLDEPVYVETYNGWDIYRTPGTGFYYAVGGNVTTAYWDSLEALKAYLDEMGPPPEEAPEEPEEPETPVETPPPGEAPGEVEPPLPERSLGWLRWLGLPVMALGAVLALRREEA